MHQTLQFIPRICTYEIDINLKWEDFSYFHVLIILATKLKSHVFQAYPNLTNFLISWFFYNKEKGIPLMRPKRTALTYWRPALEAWADVFHVVANAFEQLLLTLVTYILCTLNRGKPLSSCYFCGLHAAHGTTIFHLAIGFEFGGTMALHVAGCSPALLYP
jgi:hypothetical protein